MKPCIITAGQYSSGSTALYNLVRFLLEEKYQKSDIHYGHFSGRSSRYLGCKRGPIGSNICPIIKCHEKPKEKQLKDLGFACSRKSHLYISYRPLRQCAAGMLIKKERGLKLNQSKILKILKQNINIFKTWSNIEESKLLTKRIIHFNEILNNKEKLIEDICLDLQIDVTKEKKLEIIDRIDDLRNSKEEYTISWVSKVQSEGMQIHGGTCLYDWEEAKILADTSILDLIEEHKNEIYY